MKYETRKGRLERVRGLEPPLRAWKAIVLPLHHTRAVYPMPVLSLVSQSLSSFRGAGVWSAALRFHLPEMGLPGHILNFRILVFLGHLRRCMGHGF